MGKDMRDLLDGYGKILNESDYTSLKRRLSGELFAEIKSHQKSQIQESSLNRILHHVSEHDCAVITAFRKKLINCVNGEESENVLNIKTNKGRNITLKSTLLYLGYQVTEVKGSYIENYMQENEVEVNEDSFFVVNSDDNPKFSQDMFDLGELFCQDSVLMITNGGSNNYLIGTNNSDFPGYEQKSQLGKIKPGMEGEFMTKVGGRPFMTEDFKTLQINTKKLVTEIGRPIAQYIRKK